MGAIILSKRDLSDDLNRTQARYELNRAIDTNDTQALADWAKNWGEAALEASQNAEPHGSSFLACVQVQGLAATLLSLQQALCAKRPKIADCRKLVTDAQAISRALAAELES